MFIFFLVIKLINFINCFNVFLGIFIMFCCLVVRIFKLMLILDIVLFLIKIKFFCKIMYNINKKFY